MFLFRASASWLSLKRLSPELAQQLPPAPIHDQRRSRSSRLEREALLRAAHVAIDVAVNGAHPLGSVVAPGGGWSECWQLEKPLWKPPIRLRPIVCGAGDSARAWPQLLLRSEHRPGGWAFGVDDLVVVETD